MNHQPASHPQPVVLLLPGMTLNASVFPDVGFPVIGVDFTKLVVGPDGWSEELEQQRMRFYVRQLADRLRTEPGWRAGRRIVVGHSFGGCLALAFLLELGGDPLAEIEGLVLVATSPGPLFDAVRLRVLGGERWALRVPVNRLMRFWNHPLVTRAIARATAPNGGVTEVDFRKLDIRSDLALGLAGWRNTDWRARRSYRLAMDGFDVRERVPAIKTPSIVLQGTRDTFFSLAVAEDLARRLPRAELRIVSGAGHGLPLTHGGAVVQAVRDLLRGP